MSNPHAVPFSGLSTGTHHFTMEVSDRFFDAFDHSLVAGGKAGVQIDARKGAASLDLAVRIDGVVRVECDRCLDPLTLPVGFEGALSVRAGEGEYDGEVLYVAPAQSEVDLSQYLYESICLSLPLSRAHGLDAEGKPLCNPDMLARMQRE